jgi:hypothetical protein
MFRYLTLARVRLALMCACACIFLTFASAPAECQQPPEGRERIKCESNDERRHQCDANIGGDVRISRQISGTPCVEGRTWGWNQNGIWVDNGCRAEFEFREPGSGEGNRGGSRRRGGRERGGSYETLTCESNNNRYQECRVNQKITDVRVAQQLSSTSCDQGRSWGLKPNNKAIWVNHGCRAVFEYRRR